MSTDLQKLQTEVLEGFSSIDERMSSIIDSTKDDQQNHPPTEQPPEPSTNQNTPNSDQENQFFSPTIKEILTHLLSYLLTYIQINFPLQPTFLSPTVPSEIPSIPSRKTSQ